MEDKTFQSSPQESSKEKQDRLLEQRRRSEREFAELDRLIDEIAYLNRLTEDELRREGLL